MKRSDWKAALQKPLWEEQSLKMLKRTTKPLGKTVLIEEGLAKSSKKQHSENTDKWHLCEAGSFSYGESPRTPPLEGTSLHRWNNSVERPWGILSLFTTCLHLCVKYSATGCDMWTTPKKHTKRRETLGNANQNKTTRRAGYKKMYGKTHHWKHSELKEHHEMLDKTKTLTTIARQKKAKEIALIWSVQTGKQPYKNHSEKNRA